MIQQWHLGLLAGLIALQVALAYGTYRGYRRRISGESDAGVGQYVDAGEGVVQCPRCGTDNDLGYRFCRSCVGELPGAAGFQRAADGPTSQTMR